LARMVRPYVESGVSSREGTRPTGTVRGRGNACALLNFETRSEGASSPRPSPPKAFGGEGVAAALPRRALLWQLRILGAPSLRCAFALNSPLLAGDTPKGFRISAQPLPRMRLLAKAFGVRGYFWGRRSRMTPQP